MSKGKVEKMILEGGSSLQCKFCRRILFTDEHVQRVMASSGCHGFDGTENTIDISGYCQECRASGFDKG